MADRIISYQDQKDKLNQYHGTEININEYKDTIPHIRIAYYVHDHT